MAMASLHPSLEMRVELLRQRIAELREHLSRKGGLERIDDCIEIELLEQRYRAFRGRLEALDREGNGFRAAVKSGMAQAAYDLAASLGEFVGRLDSSYRASLPRKGETGLETH